MKAGRAPGPASLIAIQTYALDLKVTGSQAQMAPLVRLIAIEQAPGDPRAVSVERPFPHVVDARQRWAGTDGRKRDDHPLPGDEIILGSCSNDQATVRDRVLLALTRHGCQHRIQ